MTAQKGALQGLTATTAVPTGGALNVYAKFVLGSNDSVQMTSYDGYTYGVDANNKLINVTDGDLAAGTQYGRATWTVTFWYDQACTANQIEGNDLQNIDAVGTISLKVTAGDRSRVSLTAPTAKGTTDALDNTKLFGENFGASLNNYVTATVASITNGSVTWSTGQTIYYAIYGGAANDSPLKDKAALDALIGQNAQNDGESGFTDQITVTDANA